MITIIASTGFTGRLIAQELQQLRAKFILAGRNEQSLKEQSAQLGGVEYRVVDVQKADTFEALEGSRVIVNCAGPFLDYGEAVVGQAVQRKCHYLDLTGEQQFIKSVYDKYDSAAKNFGICLIPACAFEYAIGDAAGSIACHGQSSVDSLELFYELSGTGATSAGTRKSIIRAITAPGFQLSQGQLIPSIAGAHVQKLNGKTYVTFPGGEILMLPKHVKTENVSTYMASSLPSFIFGPLAKLGQISLRFLADHLVNNVGTKTPSQQDRKLTRFSISAIARNQGKKQSVTAIGSDPYGLTAAIIAKAASHIQNMEIEGKKLPSGAISPSMLAGAEFIRDALAGRDTSWTVE